MSKPLHVFLDLSISNQLPRRLTFQLYDKVPKTSFNFKSLCTGELGVSKTGYRLSYLKSTLFRIVPGFVIQGGDITEDNGLGGVSVYGKYFPDENFIYKHTRRGLLSMANSGFNSNNSQFFITLNPCPHLDGKHVVFGELINGLDVLEEIEKFGTRFGTPKQSVKVVSCGQLE